MTLSSRHIIALLAAAFLAGCSLIPKRSLPQTSPPAPAYKEAGRWLKVDPAHPGIQADWWKVFNNPELNLLEGQAARNNEDLKQAWARLKEARAEVHVDAAQLYPQVMLNAAPNTYGTSQTVKTPRTRTYSDILVEAEASYETDLWGRVKALVEADRKLAQASGDDLAAARLSVQAEVARDYFTLRGYDDLARLLDETVASYQKAYNLTVFRHKGGLAMESDVTQAQTQLYNAKTRDADNKLHRQQEEHAIAVLIGQNPSTFTLKPKKLAAAVPAPPDPGVPAALLLRRPDVASAARDVEAANAEIGVARAAYFPDLALAADAGFDSKALGTLFEAPSLIWTLGADLLTPIFEGGKLKAQVNLARGRYEETAARYRGTALSAIQSVEDALVETKQLEIEGQTQAIATTAAERTLAQMRERYKGGVTNYLDVAVSQEAALQAEIDRINIHTQRLLADIDLIRALGGGWEGEKVAEMKRGK